MRLAYLRPAILLILLLAATLVPTVARSQSQSNVFSFFAPSATPGRPGGTDQLSVELGLRFSVDSPGSLTAIRFYKGAISNSVHTVSLWTATGQLVARASTTSET